MFKILISPPGKKLKRRLEDLEKRAGSSSVSPEVKPAEVLPSQPRRNSAATDSKKRKPLRAPSVKHEQRSPVLGSSVGYSSREGPARLYPQQQYPRPLSTSRPPTSTYSMYQYNVPPPSQTQQSYPTHSQYQSMQVSYPDYSSSQPMYLPPLPQTLPSMQSYDNAPQKQLSNPFAEEDMNSQFAMSYASMAGLSAPAYATSNPYVNTPDYTHHRPA
jgi:hypothetical protein